LAQPQYPTRPAERGTAPPPVQPEDRTPEQVAADLDWLRTLRANVQRRWGGIYGGHDAHLDTLDESGEVDSDQEDQGDGLDEDRLLERALFEPDLGDDEPSEWN
jgi:hypothetical protein